MCRRDSRGRSEPFSFWHTSGKQVSPHQTPAQTAFVELAHCYLVAAGLLLQADLFRPLHLDALLVGDGTLGGIGASLQGAFSHSICILCNN